jgi:hypothetical protein
VTGIATLLRMIFTALPPQYAVPIAILGLIAAFPSWLRYVHAKQLRSQVRRVAMTTTTAERRSAEEAAIVLAAGKPRALLALAEEAHRLNQKALWERAIGDLERSNALPVDVAAFRARTAPPPPPPVGHPLEVLVIARRMLDDGLAAQARSRVVDALARYPDDPELRELLARIDAAG